MLDSKRSSENPLLLPESTSSWESEAVFNPSVLEHDGIVHMFYRATGKEKHAEASSERSVIGHATGKDGIHFNDRRPFVIPENDWEKNGCEDPRATAFEGRFYIFYTAVADFNADGIKVAVAISDDLHTITEKHLVTPFNAKAMTLFPERINGKIAVMLTVNTDRPPAKICLALLDRIEDLWSKEYWDEWYAHWQDHALSLGQNSERDQVEVGAVPVKTNEGWLFIYSYIYNYFSPPPTFGIQAALLDLENPLKLVGIMKQPFLVPEEEYEHYGRVPHIVFPSGALIRRKKLYLYYGAADTVCCAATLPLDEILEELTSTAKMQLMRFEGNPILTPDPKHAWESKAAFNPAAIYEGGKIHILYRAMGDDNTSVVGYASSDDGVHITERLAEPIYGPREDFEQKAVPGGNSGCEDPRVTKIDDRIYLTYTAYDGIHSPRVALSSISVEDFLAHRWNWTKPVLISPPGMDDKDTILFPKKIDGKYWFLHRLGSEIWIDSVNSLDFDGKQIFLQGQILMHPRDTAWDSKRIGATFAPIETKHGWLMFYHGISKRTSHYNLRVALLDLNDPRTILYRSADTVFDPETPYEKNGIVSNVVFPCGAVVKDGIIYVYYGGADQCTGVATVALKDIVLE